MYRYILPNICCYSHVHNPSSSYGQTQSVVLKRMKSSNGVFLGLLLFERGSAQLKCLIPAPVKLSLERNEEHRPLFLPPSGLLAFIPNSVSVWKDVVTEWDAFMTQNCSVDIFRFFSSLSFPGCRNSLPRNPGRAHSTASGVYATQPLMWYK